MFITGTYAWFTDSVIAGNNKIQAGNLQISLDLLEKDGSWTSIDDSDGAIFDYELWEPGYTDVKILRITNEGSLALKWMAKLTSENGLNALADVIDVYVKRGVQAYPSAASELSAWEHTGTVTEFVKSIGEKLNGSLKAEESTYFGIAFHMQETATNEYQDMSLGLFDLSILATQLSLENDSFGDDYDAVAAYDDQILFESLASAMRAINAGNVSENNSCSAGKATVAVKATGDGYIVTVLKSMTVKETLAVTAPMTLVLDGKTVAFEDTSVGISVSQGDAKLIIDGRVAKSAITISGKENTTAIEVSEGSCEIKGGTYQATSTEGKSNVPNPCINVGAKGDLIITDATVEATDPNKGTPNAICVEKDGRASICGCKLTAASPYGLNVTALNSDGDVTVEDSEIKGCSNYTGDKKLNDYTSHSRGIYNRGTMTIFDSYVLGTHSGITSIGTLLVSGGTYEAYGHGGIYFSGNNKTSYVRDAVVRWCEMPDGYYADSVAGTNHAGMYIGGRGANNIAVYVDNCHFYASVQPIVLRGTSGEKDDVLYISNSTINVSGLVRIDNNNKLCIGKGNNFDSTDTTDRTPKRGTIEMTNEDYRSIIDSAFEK